MISIFLRGLLCGLLLLSLSCKTGGQIVNKYTGETPGMTPKVFAPGLISLPDRSEFGSVLSEDGTELYYGIDIDGRTETHYSRWTKKGWSTPEVILSHPTYGYNDPFLSPDEQKLYVISDQALDGKGEPQKHDIWYVEKKAKGWSAPINAGPAINSTSSEYYMSFTKEGTMYFATNAKATDGPKRNFDVYAARAKPGGGFEEAVALPAAINTPAYEADAFIAYDESYIIFCSVRRGGLGRGDLYISFKDERGEWMPAVNMGTDINSEKHELCPFVSKDGKYFFYTSNQDIYWVDAQIIPKLRSQFRQKK
ncbi:MAG: hypothetical protein AAGG75_05020 [Bacteroidota bacterium]